jgi:hypothetical protein
MDVDVMINNKELNVTEKFGLIEYSFIFAVSLFLLYCIYTIFGIFGSF